MSLTCLLTLRVVNFATALQNEVTEIANEQARVFESRKYRSGRCIRNECRQREYPATGLRQDGC